MLIATVTLCIKFALLSVVMWITCCIVKALWCFTHVCTDLSGDIPLSIAVRCFFTDDAECDLFRSSFNQCFQLS